MSTYFSDFFLVAPETIERYGAYNVSLLTDLPLFVDPFLLFNSKKPEYRALHDGIIDYLIFLKNKSTSGSVDEQLLEAWYCFPEVKQTWLGFTLNGNGGHGLGMEFAKALHSSLGDIFSDFGAEKITKGSHLEKVCLIKDGVGRDNISDFTTNLVKDYLCQYTADFAKSHIDQSRCSQVAVRGTKFNYMTEVWEAGTYTLPFINNDFVLLVPKDMLTRDETWINRHDLINDFAVLPIAVPDGQLRAQINNYFEKELLRRPLTDRAPSKKEREAAAVQTIKKFPELIDRFIRLKEDRGSEASDLSAEKVRGALAFFVAQVRAFQQALSSTDFYSLALHTLDETRDRANYLKQVIENGGGHHIFYRDGKPVARERDLQIMFKLVWFGTPSDVSSEVNDGRGPADFKISIGASDKTIVEMKLASNKALRKNLAAQAQTYQKASQAQYAIKIIVYFTYEELRRVKKILQDLRLESDPNVVLIDARLDNKPSGSKATLL